MSAMLKNINIFYINLLFTNIGYVSMWLKLFLTQINNKLKHKETKNEIDQFLATQNYVLKIISSSFYVFELITKSQLAPQK